MRFWKRKIFLWIGLPLLILFLSVMGILKSLEDSQELFLKTKIFRGDLRQVVRGTGYLEADEVVSLTSHLDGHVKILSVDAGESVQKGGLLFEIENTDFQKEYRLTKAKYRQAKLELKKLLTKSNEASAFEAEAALEKAKKATAEISKEFSDKNDLFQKGFVSKKDMDEVKDRLDNVQVEEKLALKRFEEASKPPSREEVELKKAEISKMKLELKNLNEQWEGRRATASFDGLVVEIFKKKGDSVKKGEPLLTMVDVEKPWVVEGAIYEADIPKIKKGEKVSVKFLGVQGVYQAQIDEVSLVAKMTGNVRKFPVKILIQDKIQGPLRLGIGAEYEILIDEHKNVLMMPLQFVAHQKDESGVWILQGKKKVFVPLKSGLSDESFVEIVSGLVEGQEVVLPNINSKKDFE